MSEEKWNAREALSAYVDEYGSPEVLVEFDALVAVAQAAGRLTEREGPSPWLAISPYRLTEKPICFGCGVTPDMVRDMLVFAHELDCPAWDLAVALAEIGDADA